MTIRPAYTYAALVTAIYDGDTIVCDIDLFDHLWKRDEVIRLYGINANEIKQSKAHKRGASHVKDGFKHRDALMGLLGIDPAHYPRTTKYHKLAQPVPIVIQTIKDTSGKFGRLLGIIHRGEVNINERLRDILGGVEFYDGKAYALDCPIVPPV